MVSYEPFWKTLKEKGITQYSLINDFDISSSLLSRMKQSKPVNLSKINDLCLILGCSMHDIVVFVKDPSETEYDIRILKYKDKIARRRENEKCKIETEKKS